MKTKLTFFLVGAPKAGTTSIYEYLRLHPEVYVPNIKEPNYFVDVGQNCPTADHIVRENDYWALFDKVTTEKAIGECSVSYMHSPDAAMRIRSEIGEAKIVMILRHPIERAFSHWLMDMREGLQKKEFLEAVYEDMLCERKGFCYSHMYIDCSLYSEAIKNYRQVFGEHNVKIVVYDDLKINLNAVVKEVFDFIGVDSSIRINVIKPQNEAAEPRNVLMAALFHNMQLRVFLKKLIPKALRKEIRGLIMKPATERRISPEERLALRTYFEADILATEELLERDLSTWKN